MKFSIRVNNDLAIDELVSVAQQAEGLGFDQIWFSNDLFLRSAPVLTGILSAETERIELGIGIMNPYSVHPSELAMLASTASEATGGRFNLGLAAGAAEFLGWAGMQQDRPLSVTRDAVIAIRALLSGQTPDLPGWKPEGYLRFPFPAKIYLGAMSPKMTRLIGEVADGGLPLLYPPEHFATAQAYVAEGAAIAGRSMRDIDLPACVWVATSRDDLAAAQRSMAEKIAYYGSAFGEALLLAADLDPAEVAAVTSTLESEGLDAAVARVTPQMLRLGIVGLPEDVVERCMTLVAMGARHVSFGPPLGPQPRDAIRVLGEDVMPEVRARAGV